MCCRRAKDGVDAVGVEHSVDPGIQLILTRRQNLSPICLRNTVEASIEQPDERFCLTCGLTFSSTLSTPFDTSLFSFLCHDRHHRLPLLIGRLGQRRLDRPPVDRVVRPVDVYKRTDQNSATQQIIDRRQHRRPLPVQPVAVLQHSQPAPRNTLAG
jgi:hypothetical protein